MVSLGRGRETGGRAERVMDKVLVTGVTGHVGFNLAKRLAEKGYSVVGGVRDLGRARSIDSLRQLPIELVEMDLLDEPSIVRALDGTQGFFQVGAVYRMYDKDPEREVVQPNLEGTRNALRAAAKAGVGRVVYTSSIAAVGVCGLDDPGLDESHWHDDAVEPYTISKTRSEREAWQLAEELGLDVVTVLPATILGGDFHQLTPSLMYVDGVLKGKTPMAYPGALSYVDVHDVAEAHVLVYESAEAKGRYIAAAETVHWSDVVEVIKSRRPSVRASSKVMPNWIARGLPALEAVISLMTGAPRSLSSSAVQQSLGKAHRFTSTRLRDELGWSPRSFAEMIDDTLLAIEAFHQRRRS